MLKPGDPSGSAFLKVDPTYIQHWQQLFPQSQLKNAALAQLQPADRVAIPVESLRQRPHLISSASTSVALTPSSMSSSVSSLVGLTQLSGPQIALFGQTICSDITAADNSTSQAKELCLPSNFKNDKDSRLKLTSEELDYYLYGQQRMEIIPLNNHTGDLNNRMYDFIFVEYIPGVHRPFDDD
ncbi:hypothetical protein P4O66_004720 [Electrophorus voltai]|uniref:Histone-lysine N-methyltransferase PRDM6 n=1 Tax=Electrophorus voltai TaxID=2609070 RepID=A0AAD8ZL04_9TELE|nr:hypothetical protein P4O66_004720 [Electrophorus voltai]